MNLKYPKTLHLPWSPGVSNSDRVANDVSSLLNIPIIITEKIDGSNSCLESSNCFARSHSGPPSHPSFDALKALHSKLKFSIPNNVQIYGEWCYALHSIAYDKLPDYFLIFGIRELQPNPEFNFWYSWGELEEWAMDLSLSTVPVLFKGQVSSEKELKDITESLANNPSIYGPVREGVVVRTADIFNDNQFSKYVLKWVRKNHVNTDSHWMHKKVIKNSLKQK